MVINLWVERGPGIEPKVCTPERFAELKKAGQPGRLVAVEGARTLREARDTYHRWEQGRAEAARVLGIEPEKLTEDLVARGLALLARQQPHSAGYFLGAFDAVKGY